MFFSILSAAALAVSTAAAAVDVQPKDDPDVRCLYAFATVGDAAESKEDEAQFYAVILFFLGRLEGRGDNIDVAAGLSALEQDKSFDQQAMATELGRCAQALQRVSDKFDAIDKARGS